MPKKLLLTLLLSLLAMPNSLWAANLSSAMSGKILIAVEQKGEAWYVNPTDQKRYYLGRPADAFLLMKQLALGINNATYQTLTKNLPLKLIGRIVLNVDNKGAAYYLSPTDRKLYSLGRPAEAFAIMRQLGIGITTANLQQIQIGKDKPVDKNDESFLSVEKAIQELVNDEREKNGLSRLAWNSDIAAVAREHSQNQATDNIKIIDQNKLCSYPFIHHEGKTFGLYHSNRLNERGLYYFSASAENIALIPRIQSTRYDSANITPIDCQAKLNQLNKDYEAAIEEALINQDKVNLLNLEITKRIKLTEQSPTIKIISQEFNTLTQVETDAVVGWMNSPGHRKNILNGAYDEAGVGMTEIDGYYIITQNFIKRADCGYKNGACCQKEGFYPYCYIPWDCTNNICQ